MINGVRINNFIGVMNNQQSKINNSANPLEKAKANLEKNMQSINNNNNLSNDEKNKKISELEKQIDELNVQISQKKLEDIKEKAKEVVEKAVKKATKDASENNSDMKSYTTALNYGLISASSNNNEIKKLYGYRKVAVRQDGENSAKISRIDSMIAEKTKSVKKELSLMRQAVEKYSKQQKNEKSRLKSNNVDVVEGLNDNKEVRKIVEDTVEEVNSNGTMSRKSTN